MVTPRGGLDLLVEWIHGANLTNVYQLLCPLTNGLGTEYRVLGTKWRKRGSEWRSWPPILVSPCAWGKLGPCARGAPAPTS